MNKNIEKLILDESVEEVVKTSPTKSFKVKELKEILNSVISHLNEHLDDDTIYINNSTHWLNESNFIGIPKVGFINLSDIDVIKEDLEQLPDIQLEEPITINPNEIEVPEVDPVVESNGFISMISDLIKDEWSTIDRYNGTISMFRDEITNMEQGDKDSCITILQDIVNEELMHVGQLEEIVTIINKEYGVHLENGSEEAKEQIENSN